MITWRNKGTEKSRWPWTGVRRYFAPKQFVVFLQWAWGAWDCQCQCCFSSFKGKKNPKYNDISHFRVSCIWVWAISTCCNATGLQPPWLCRLRVKVHGITGKQWEFSEVLFRWVHSVVLALGSWCTDCLGHISSDVWAHWHFWVEPLLQGLDLY